MARVKQLLSLLFILSLHLSGVAAGAQCNEGDRKALLNIKAAIREDPSGVLTSWGLLPDCCNANWLGVTCDATTGRVTQLHLSPSDPSNSSLYMLGKLSQSVGYLTELFYLQLPGWRNITGEIPNSIARLQKLDLLDLGNNAFVGRLPSWIPSLTILRVLILSGNRLRGSIPPAITTMHNLAVLELDGNRITGTIPRAMWNLTKLDILILSNNLLYGSLPDLNASTQTALFMVDVSHNALVGSIPESYGHLPYLGLLYLNSNKLSGSIPSSLGSLRKLSRLELEDNLLTGYIPPSLGSLSQLSYLDLSRNFLRGPIPSSFSQLNFLSTLYVSGNRLTNPLPSLPAFPTWLDLSFNEFKMGNSIPTWITNSSFSGIQIGLAGCGIDLPIEDMNHWLISFTSFDLSSNNISGSPVQILESMDNVRYANLSNNRLTYNFSSQLTFPVSYFETLDLHSNHLYGSIPPSIGKSINLKTLDLSRNGLTGNIPREMLNLTNLKQLDVSYNQLCGEIPQGKPLTGFPVSVYSHNKCLCGLPLRPC